MAEDPKTKEYASSCEFKQIALYKVGDETNVHANLIGMGVTMQYHEDIFWPSYGATLTVVDNAENLISRMPIQGFEKVVVEIEDVNNKTYSYDFRVWTVQNRVTRERRNTYTLGLISEQGLLNEGIRVNSVVKGNTSTVVKEMLSQYFQIPEDKVDAEPSATSIKFIPTKKTPFALIRSLAPKTISERSGNVAAEKAKPETTTIKKKVSTARGTKTRSVTVKTDINTALTSQATGTAGYLFFQTRKGFVFRSVDNLVDTGEKFGGKQPFNKEKPFFMQPGGTGEAVREKIQEIRFGKELNMMKKMREGAYSSLCCFFNINTGEYEEHIYSLEKMWGNMAHSGPQAWLPLGQSNLSKYPTRVMSSIVNHENWYVGTEVASNEPQHGGSGSNPFPDWQKNFLTQSIARYGILFNQELSISVTGHLELCAGDKVFVRLPNQVPDDNKEDVWDPEHSGVYLVKRLNHLFNIPSKSVYTVLELIRDSYGVPDQETETE